MKAMNQLWFHVRKGKGLVSFLTAKTKEKIPSIMVYRTTAFFVRQQCLIKSICHIDLRTVLASVLTNSLSRTDLEDPWVIGLARLSS